ncbi:MAG: hypothetical protein HUJ75_04775 [Parasporobacterium sp.]|nr:hypothetical protein [Parasporobacterium sp.]
MAEQKNSDKLSRTEGISRAKSPEQLNEYIRVVRPHAWIILVAITALLAGLVIWSVFGTIEKKIDVGIGITELEESDVKKAYCYVNADYFVQKNDSVQIYTDDGVIAKSKVLLVDDNIIIVDANQSYAKENTNISYMMYMSGLRTDDLGYLVMVDPVDLEPGIYKGKITIERIRPINLIFNTDE